MNIHEKVEKARRVAEYKVLKEYIDAKDFVYHDMNGVFVIDGCMLRIDHIDRYGNLFLGKSGSISLMPTDIMIKFAKLLRFLQEEKVGPDVYPGRSISHFLVNYFELYHRKLDAKTVSEMIYIDYLHGEDQDFKRWLFGVDGYSDWVADHGRIDLEPLRSEEYGLPDTVTIYRTKHGSKIHLSQVCVYGEDQEISESDFLDLLMKGEGCKNCIPQPAMIDIVKCDLKKKGR